jgi:hypothetical protein
MGAAPRSAPISIRPNVKSANRNTYAPGRKVCKTFIRRFDSDPRLQQLSLEVSVNVFNVLNHPAFANPVPFLSSPFFGQPTSMQNLMLGSGTPNTGLPPLFQTGGARAGEFSFRFTF